MGSKMRSVHLLAAALALGIGFAALAVGAAYAEGLERAYIHALASLDAPADLTGVALQKAGLTLRQATDELVKGSWEKAQAILEDAIRFLGQEGRTVPGYKNAVFSGLTTNALAGILGNIIEGYPDLSGVVQVASSPISKYDLLVLLKKVYGMHIDIRPDTEDSVDGEACIVRGRIGRGRPRSEDASGS